jgi:hypothetical protein
MFYRLLFIIICLWLGGCATYMPASEGIIWHDYQDGPYGVRGATFGHGEMGFSYSPVILPGPLRGEVRRRYEEKLYGQDDLVFYQRFLAAPPLPVASIPLARKAAFGISIIPLYPSLDATVHLFEDFWVTGSLQSPVFVTVNTEIIFQRPVYRSENGGVSVGAFYRYEHLSVFRDGVVPRLTNLVPASTFPMEWMGGRILAQIPVELPLPPVQKAGARMRLHLHGGYSPMYNSALFTFGVGLYFRPNSRLPRPDPFQF